MRINLPRCAPNAVALFVASALLIGCANSGSRVVPSGLMQQNAARLGPNTDAVPVKSLISPLGGEVFASINVTVTEKTCGGGLIKSRSADFTADGKSKGPYSGSFAAHGSWAWATVPVGGRWSFFEKFKITSGTRTVFGKIVGEGKGNVPSFLMCKTFGPVTGAGLKYHSWIDGIRYSGPMTGKGIAEGSLGEMFRP